MTPHEEIIIYTNNKLLEARRSYYVDNSPIMSDAEYDRCEKDLRDMIQATPSYAHLATALTTVGSDLDDGGTGLRHSSPMLSLENKYTYEEVTEWCNAFPEGTAFVVEPKVDGLSCALIYLNRVLVRALTRGDGVSGSDITKVMIASGAVPTILSEEAFPESLIEVRGEIYIPQHQFDIINSKLDKKFVSPRNLAAGAVKLLDLDLVRERGLKFYPWQVEGIPHEYLAKRNLSSNFANHPILYFCGASVGMPQLAYSTFYYPGALVAALDGYLRNYREVVLHKGKGIGTDGYVIKILAPELRKFLGQKTNYPNWACCFKYPSVQVTTTLEKINWSVGRSGGLTPVGVVTPVNVSGAVVTNINLNNYSWVESKGLKIGDTVSISRAGEVIPYLHEVVASTEQSILVEEPSICSHCNSPIVKEVDPKSKVVSHYCPNSACPGRLKAYLEYVASRDVLEIDDLGPETVSKLINDGYVTSLEDLFDFSNNILEGLATKSKDVVVNKLNKLGYSGVTILKMCKSIEKAKQKDWDRWLAALGIPGIGKTLAKTLAIHFRLREENMASLPTTLANGDYSMIDGVGEKKEKEIKGALPVLAPICKALYESGVKPKSLVLIQEDSSKPLPLSGFSICITGEFNLDRDAITKILVSLGATVKTSVSSKLTHLLIGDFPGQSKLAKARNLNIPMLHYDWLKNYLDGIEDS